MLHTQSTIAISGSLIPFTALVTLCTLAGLLESTAPPVPMLPCATQPSQAHHEHVYSSSWTVHMAIQADLEDIVNTARFPSQIFPTDVSATTYVTFVNWQIISHLKRGPDQLTVSMHGSKSGHSMRPISLKPSPSTTHNCLNTSSSLVD